MQATATRCQLTESTDVWSGAAGNRDNQKPYGKLRGKIIEKYGSINSFGDHLSISQTQLSKKLTGKAGFSQQDIIEWCELLGINLEEVGPYFFALKV